jgi:acetyl-CoA carboxylase biotin carboxyl carrier protein
MSDKKNGIDKGLIRDLANILNDTDLTEIEVEQDDVRIRVSRVGTLNMSRLRSQRPPMPRLQLP